MEEWRDVKGYEGIYRVSNCGGLIHYRDGKWQSLSIKNRYGWYLTIRLFKDGKVETKRIHRLVYEAFVGEIPNGYAVHHKDFNRQNNRVENLEVLSKKEHTKKHCEANPNILNGMRMYNKYIRPRRIFQYSMDGALLGVFSNAQEAGRKTGVCARNISQVAHKTEWKPGKVRKQAGGYIWKEKE